jgi:REP element-mobilizing transposase RayT
MPFYHVWFSTKWRRPVLEGEVRQAVLDWFRSIADEIGVEIEAMEAFEDHAHLLIGLDDWKAFRRRHAAIQGSFVA